MKSMKQWISLLLVMVFVLGNVLTVAAEDETTSISAPLHLSVLRAGNNPRNAGTNGMENLLSSVTIKDSNGNLVTSTATLGETYKFSMVFKEDGPYKQFVLQDGTLVYKFPDNIKIKDTTNYPVFNGTTKIGEYTIRDNQLVFTPMYTSDGESYSAVQTEGSYSFVDFFGNAWLNFEFDGTFEKEGKQEEIDFGGGVKVIVDVEQKTPTPKLEVKKESKVSENKKEILYTVTAKVTEADATKLVIKDQIWNTEGIGQLDVNRLTVRIKKTDGTFETVDPSQYTLKVNNSENGDNRYHDFELTFKGDIPKDTEYVIDYPISVNYDDLAKKYDKIRIGGNEITAETDNDRKTSYTYGHEFEGTKKVGKDCTGSDKDKQLLKWKLTIGNGTTDIADKTATDRWTKPAGVSAIALDTTEDIVIKLYDDFSKLIDTITIGKDDTELRNQYFKAISTNDGFDFVVPSSTKGTVKRCTVEYYTKVTRDDNAENPNQTVTVTNNGGFDGDLDGANGSIGGGGSDTSNKKTEITKTITANLEDYYEFSLNLKVPAEMIGFWFVVHDELGVGDYPGTKINIPVRNHPENIRITATSASVSTPIEFEAKKENTQPSQYHYEIHENGNVFEINFNPLNGTVWQWPYQEDVELSIVYRISKDALAGQTGDRGHLKDIDEGYLNNGVYASGSDWTSASDKLTREIRKSGKVVDAARGIIEYTVNINQDYAGIIPDKPFIDQYADSLSYVEDSFKVELYANLWGDGVKIAEIQGNPDTSVARQLKFDLDISGSGWEVKDPDNQMGQLYGWGATRIDLFKKTPLWFQGGLKAPNPALPEYANARGRLVITYRMQVDSDVILEGENVNLENTASMEGFRSATAYVSYKPKLLDKTCVKQGNVLKYTIEVNERSLQLSNDGKLNLTDIMTNATPDLGTIKVWNTEENKEVPSQSWSVKYNGSNKLEFTLPDATPIRITYDAYPHKAAGSITVENHATLSGMRTDSSGTSESITVNNGGGAGGGQNVMFFIYKVDEVTREPLANATFTLERFETGGPNKGGWYTLGTVTTDDHGQVRIHQFSANGNPEILHTNMLYRIKETQAPQNYVAAGGYRYFAILEGKTLDVVYGECTTAGLQGVTKEQILPLENAGSITMENRRKEISFAFNKITSGGAPLSGATFTLTENGTTNVKTAISEADGSVSFRGLEPGKTYILEETQAPNGYMRSTRTWTITVNTDGSIAVTDENGDPVSLNNDVYVFINEQLPDLPSVGGSGTLAYSLFGLALMAMAAAAAYALAEKRRRIER